MTPRDAVVVAWCPRQPRTVALAAALDGEAVLLGGGRRGSGARLAIRYLRDGITTWRRLSARDPEVVVAVSPPVFTPLVAWAWCHTRGRRLVIDCHTGAFHSREWGWSRPIHRWLARRAEVTLLHTEAMEAEVRGWGARALLLPDDVPDPAGAESRPRAERPRVLVAGALDATEPVEAAIEAARLIPDVEMVFTGDHNRVDPRLRAAAPANVVFTGWLDHPRFLGEMLAADVVGAFSCDPQVMNRAAFEAVGMSRPLVLSDQPGLRARLEGVALFCRNEPSAMADALLRAIADRAAMADRSRAAQERLRAQHAGSVERLRTILDAPGRPHARPRGRGPRVLMISQHPFPSNPTLRRNVEHLLRQGATVDVVCTTDHLDHAPRHGLRVHAVRLAHRRLQMWYPLEYLAFFAAAFPRVCRLSLRTRYDVVQVDNLPDFLVFAALPARLRGARVVLFMYELMPELTASRLQVRIGHPVVRLSHRLESVATAWAGHVVVVTEHCRRTLVERGVEPHKLSVVPNTQAGVGQHVRDDVSSGRPSMVIVTTLIERYGVHVALEALARLREEWPELTLDVLGEGEARPRLEQLARRLGVADRVHFRGYVPWNEAMTLVRDATLGIVPVVDDGYGSWLLPNKLLEYVSHGVPAVCSRLTTMVDYFPEGSVAYFEPGSPAALAGEVDRLLRDPGERRRQARRAREAYEAVRWENVAGRYDAALLEKAG
ncbi:MAG TPA: glycosyltransferase [Candidatus Dormibacteraeota bacterium]